MATARQLSAQDQQLLAHLCRQWDKPMRLMTLGQGMAALGQPRDAARRLRLGDYLLTHQDVHPAVAHWGARTFLLTEDEKLLGRYLVQQERNGRGAVAVGDTAKALGLPVRQVGRSLSVLQRAGLLEWRWEDDAIAYAFAPNWRELAGPLAFTFHTVQREDGERFNVP